MVKYGRYQIFLICLPVDSICQPSKQTFHPILLCSLHHKISLWTHALLFLSGVFKLTAITVVLMPTSSHIWSTEAPLVWLLHPFWQVVSEHFLAFGTDLLLRLSHAFPALALESRNLGSFPWTLWCRNQDLSTKCAHCSWDAVSFRLGVQAEVGNKMTSYQYPSF